MRLIALVLAGFLLVACGEDPAMSPPGDAEEAEMLEGTLGGDAELEGGCAWLDADQGRFEVRYPQGYEIAFDPLRLLGPGGETLAEEGQAVRVEGRVADEMMSVCQVGPIFEASAVLPGS